MKERPILFSKRKAQGCFRAGVSRPWRYKGGKKDAQKRYRETHKDILKTRHKKEYERNKQYYKKYRQAYIKKNREKVYRLNAEWQRKFWAKLTDDIITAYGGKCNCCGEAERKFLQLDHIYNDGNIHRKILGNGRQVQLWLRDNNYPKDRYQLLCANCNQGKKRNGGICPHKKRDL